MRKLYSLLLILLVWANIMVAQPVITSFSPGAGSIGSLVTINGTSLDNPTNITLGGISPIIISNDGNTLVAMVMPGSTTGNISITTGSGTTNSATNFTVTATLNPNIQQGNKLVGTGNTGTSLQGNSVSVSADGNTAIVGGYADNGGVGAAWIYTRNGSIWTQQGSKLVGTGSIGNAWQGSSVSISADGNTVIVGGYLDNSSIGAAWIFTRSGTTWVQQGSKLVGTGYTGIDIEQGTSVSISADGNTAIVGGNGDDNYIGAAWIFARSGNSWAQQGSKLVGTGYDLGVSANEIDQGKSVSISADGNTAIVGGNVDNDYIGAAWIYTRSGSTWTQQGSKLVANDYNLGSAIDVEQGISVSLSADGNTAIVGGSADGDYTGATWIYTRSGSTWTQQGSKLLGTDATVPSGQGNFVSISADGNTALVGGSSDNGGKGAVWIFTRTGSTWAQQGNKLVGANNTGAAAQGYSACISADGNTAIVGGNGDNGGIGAAWIFAPLNAPVATSATNISTSGFSANWNASTGATKYYLTIDDNSDFSSPLASYDNLDVGNVHTYSISALPPNKTYYYQVRAYNTNGTSANSNTISLTTSKITLTITGIGTSNKPYDRNTTATITGTPVLNGVYGSELVDLVSTGAVASFADKNVGNSKVVTISGYTISGADAGNYNLSQPTGFTANITSIVLTITGVTASDKEYDGNNTASLSGGSISGLIPGDAVTLNTGNGSFADGNLGNSKPVTATGYTITGADAGNYTISQPTGMSANITVKTLTITSISASDKIYDQTNSASLSGGTLSGVIGIEAVYLSLGSGIFADKNVGNNKPITASGYSISGPNAGNYTLSQPTNLTGNVTSAPLTITGASASNKVYDGTNTASLSGGSISGVFSGDLVNLGTIAGTFADKNVGNAKTITIASSSISGTDAANYIITTTLSANITSKPLTITGVIANNKEYDGTITDNLSGGSLSGIISGDVVTLNTGTGTGTFADKYIGISKPVTAAGFTITGTDAPNYTISQPTGLSANITIKTLTITGVSVNDKIYDATNTANLNGGALSGVAGGEVVNLIVGTGNFANKTVANNKPITVTGYSISGTDAGNYNLSQPTGLTANITAKTLTITGVLANNKVYDATTVATLTGGNIIGLISGDVATLNAGTGSFVDANTGTGKAVTASGYTITGTDAGNYSLTQPANLVADISKATPVITWSNPADIASGTALGATQLNAIANFAGTFVYNPISGTILNTGNNQPLKVDFTPTDATNYNTASKTVNINVTPATGFEALPENQVSVYPNPSSGIVILKGLSSFAGSKLIKIAITDQNGKNMIIKTIKNEDDIEYLDISQLNNGVYIINMQTDKERIVKRIVKE